MGRKSLVRHLSHTHINTDGSQDIIDEKVVVAHNDKGDPFGMIFFKYMGWMYGVTNPTALKLLLKFAEMAEFNTGRFKLNSFDKGEIVDMLGISRVTFYSALKLLVDNDVIKKIVRTNANTGEQCEIKDYYMINPDMFWRGDLKNRKCMKVTFEEISNDEYKNIEQGVDIGE